MKTRESTSPTMVLLELDLELRKSKGQLLDAQQKLREAEVKSAELLARRQTLDGIVKAVTQLGEAALTLGPMATKELGFSLPSDKVRLAQEGCKLLGEIGGATEGAASIAERTASLVAERVSHQGEEESSIDEALAMARTALLGRKSI